MRRWVCVEMDVIRQAWGGGGGFGGGGGVVTASTATAFPTAANRSQKGSAALPSQPLFPPSEGLERGGGGLPYKAQYVCRVVLPGVRTGVRSELTRCGRPGAGVAVRGQGGTGHSGARGGGGGQACAHRGLAMRRRGRTGHCALPADHRLRCHPLCPGGRKGGATGLSPGRPQAQV